MTAPHPQHRNNVGALRLLLSLLVVLSHAPELLDGDRSRELLTGMFGTLSFGELAVDGFFLISGYLVTQSWVATGGGGPYFMRRILRIVPGFLVAYAISLLVFGPFGGGHLEALGPEGAAASVLRALLLLPPPTRPWPGSRARSWAPFRRRRRPCRPMPARSTAGRPWPGRATRAPRRSG